MPDDARAAATRLAVDGRVLDDRYHGIGRVTAALLTELGALAGEADTPQVTVFLRRDQRSKRFDIEALTHGSGHATAVFDHSLSGLSQFVAWPRALKAVGADVALFPYNLSAALSGRARRFTVVHDCIIEESRAYSIDQRTRLLYMALTAVVVRRNRVLTPSLASAAAVQRYYRVTVPPGDVVTWGVDPSFARARDRTTQVDGRPIPERYLLHVGARRPHKNVGVLVQALEHLPPDVHLVLVGTVDGRFPDHVGELARAAGVQDRVVHLPFVAETDLLGLYAGALAFTYPSLVEGFGLPLLEAMAAGTPVVASDIPVFRELARDAAVLVDPRDPRAWAAAVTALGDPGRRDTLVERGRAVAAEATWARTTRALVRILTSA